MSQFSNYPLEGDGLIEHLFYYLWMKDELDQGPVINIPDTIIYKYRQPAFWYFTASNGQVKRKSKYNLLNAKIEETFTKNKRGCDIVAYYLTRGAHPSDVTIEYFDKAGFHDFLYKREKTDNGIIQRFIEPKGTHNTMIRAIWSPKVCLLERRQNVHNLQDTRRFSMYDRAITYEGPDVNSRADPVRGSILPSQVQRTCQSLVNHVAEVSFQKHRIKRLAGNFKVDPKDRVWFLWATSLRIEHTGELSPRSHKRLLKEGITPGAPVNIDALLHLPSSVRITTSIPKAGKPPISTTGITLFDCPSCGRTVQPDYCHKVSYKTIVEHFQQLLTVMGAGSFDRSRGGGGSSLDVDSLPRDGLAWPPDPEVVAALGGVGLGGAMGLLGKSHGNHVPSEEDLVIPPVLRLVSWRTTDVCKMCVQDVRKRKCRTDVLLFMFVVYLFICVIVLLPGPPQHGGRRVPPLPPRPVVFVQEHHHLRGLLVGLRRNQWCLLHQFRYDELCLLLSTGVAAGWCHSFADSVVCLLLLFVVVRCCLCCLLLSFVVFCVFCPWSAPVLPCSARWKWWCLHHDSIHVPQPV